MSLTLNKVAGSPIIRKLNDTEMTFPLLTVRDWSLLGSKLEAQNKVSQKSTIEMLLAAGAVKASALGALIRELSRNPTYYEISQWILTPAGAIEVLFISLSKNNKEVKIEDIGNLCEIEKLIATANEVAAMGDVFIDDNKKEGENKDFLAPTSKTPTGSQ